VQPHSASSGNPQIGQLRGSYETATARIANQPATVFSIFTLVACVSGYGGTMGMSPIFDSRKVPSRMLWPAADGYLNDAGG
jgi:hypothetical protein